MFMFFEWFYRAVKGLNRFVKVFLVLYELSMGLYSRVSGLRYRV